MTNAKLFLVAFVAGSTLVRMGPGVRDAFLSFGEWITERAKVAALGLGWASLVSSRPRGARGITHAEP